MQAAKQWHKHGRTRWLLTCMGVGVCVLALIGCSQLPKSPSANSALQQQYEADLAYWQSLVDTDPNSYWPAMAQAQHRLAELHWQAQRLPEAKQAYTQALRLERLLARQTQAKPQLKLKQDEAIASTLGLLGRLNERSGDFTAARQQYQEALVLLRGLVKQEPRYRMQLAAVLNNLGTLQEQIGQDTQALSYFEEALDLQRLALVREQAQVKTQKPTPAKSLSSANIYWSHIATSLNNLGYLNHKTGDTAQARAQLEEALKIRQTLTQQVSRRYAVDWALTLVNLADLNRSEKLEQQARRHYQEALGILLAKEKATTEQDSTEWTALVRSVQAKLDDLKPP